MQRDFDIIVWGATGFTGKLVSEHMFDEYTHSNLSFALGGRSQNKLDAVAKGRDAETLVADAMDPQAMAELAQRARVIISTVGPYARYGSELVAACAEHGTHYCDLTGEVHWMRKMIDAHQATAQASGARIVPTCGFDSIPSDLGTYFIQQQMIERHEVPARHVKFRVKSAKGGFSGGTADSMIAMMEEAERNPTVMDIIADPYALNEQRGLDGRDSNQGFYDEDFQCWIAPFVMAPINTRVVRRSNELLGHMYGHDFRYDEGIQTTSNPLGAVAANAIGIGTGAMNNLTRVPAIRKLMARVMPQPGEGPSDDTIANGFFDIDLLAIHPTDSSNNLRGKVKGKKDPGYGATAKMLAESGVCLAQDELPDRAGFLTPAAAMGDALLARLPENADVTFEVVS